MWLFPSLSSFSPSHPSQILTILYFDIAFLSLARNEELSQTQQKFRVILKSFSSVLGKSLLVVNVWRTVNP